MAVVGELGKFHHKTFAEKLHFYLNNLLDILDYVLRRSFFFNSIEQGKTMSLQDDIQELMDTLKKQRDEISLKVHLASMDAKEEWEKAETNWGKFSAKAGEIYDDTVETTDELIDAAKVIGEELSEAYQRIKQRL